MATQMAEDSKDGGGFPSRRTTIDKDRQHWRVHRSNQTQYIKDLIFPAGEAGEERVERDGIVGEQETVGDRWRL